MAKPDDRSDNVEKLQNMIDDTMENMREARDYVKAHSDHLSTEEKNNIIEKNERRDEAIAGFREEIKDEVKDMQ